VMQRDGVDAVTTNRIARAAGVSVGSVYQYFPDKRAIFAALHDRHVERIGAILDRTVVAHAASSLEDTVRALIAAMIEAHASEPTLHELLSSQLPPGADGARALDGRLGRALRVAVTSRARERQPARDVDRHLFVLVHVIEALAHGAVSRRPPRLSIAAATDEAVRAVMAYLRS